MTSPPYTARGDGGLTLDPGPDDAVACAVLRVYRGSPERYLAFITPEAFGALQEYGHTWTKMRRHMPRPEDPIFLVQSGAHKNASIKILRDRVTRMATKAGAAWPQAVQEVRCAHHERLPAVLEQDVQGGRVGRVGAGLAHKKRVHDGAPGAGGAGPELLQDQPDGAGGRVREGRAGSDHRRLRAAPALQPRHGREHTEDGEREGRQDRAAGGAGAEHGGEDVRDRRPGRRPGPTSCSMPYSSRRRWAACRPTCWSRSQI